MSRLSILIPALLALALPAEAAPLPSRVAPNLDRYLPDDTDFVLVLNAKRVLASPLFTGHYKKLLREALKHPLAQTWLEGTGFDPLADVEYVVLSTGKSCFPDSPEEYRKGGAGPLILVQGKFDAAKLHARLAQLAKEGPDKVQIHGEGRGKFYESKSLFPFQSTFLVVGKDALILTMRRDRAEEALARVMGKTKPRLKYKEVADFVKKLDSDAAAQALALDSSIWGTTVSNQFAGGMPTTTIRHITLSDAGITRLQGTVTVKTEISGSATLRVKEAKVARELADQMKAGLAEATRELERMMGRDEKIKPFLEAFRGVKVEAKGPAVGVKFKGGPKALEGAFHLIFGVRAAAGAAPPPKAVEKDK
jgi:hypothetical protein